MGAVQLSEVDAVLLYHMVAIQLYDMFLQSCMTFEVYCCF